MSHFEWKDIIDIAVLCSESGVFDGFGQVYTRAIQREGLLEDLAFFSGLCIEAVRNSSRILELAKPALVKDILAGYISEAFRKLHSSSQNLSRHWITGPGPE